MNPSYLLLSANVNSFDVFGTNGQTPKNPVESVFVAATDTNVWIKVIDTGATVLAILFLVSFLIMILAATFKQGQWKKYAQVTALATFTGTVILRALPFTLMSIPTLQQADVFLDHILLLLMQCILFVALIGLAVGLLLKLGYKLIEHPDFYKAYRTVTTVSVVVVVFSIIIPTIIV
ncbi:hypothetical protein D7X33_19220 [Butyricicoccus sp. 1XD8-22]|nr:hypothetical protein D7X33_19220 [Butyricicoccus sp. 1XD8-22]